MVEVGGLLLGDLDTADGSLLVEVHDVQVAQVLAFHRADDLVVVVVARVEDGSRIPLDVQHDVVNIHPLRLHQQQLQLSILSVRLLGFHHLHQEGP